MVAPGSGGARLPSAQEKGISHWPEKLPGVPVEGLTGEEAVTSDGNGNRCEASQMEGKDPRYHDTTKLRLKDRKQK
jgi:hypothetical protein